MNPTRSLPHRIISGGQTGVDRAALDAALACDMPIGGWCPRGRRAEDGVIDSRYTLRETESDDYLQRTEFNVRDSDGTLIIAPGQLTGGTARTEKLTHQYHRPGLVIDPDHPSSSTSVHSWLIDNRVETLNVAGPRESGCPGIYEKAFRLIQALLIDLHEKYRGD